jgi:hypothetical protein
VGLGPGLGQHLDLGVVPGDALRDVLQGVEAGRNLNSGAGVGQRPAPGQGGEQEQGGGEAHENDSQIT